MKILIIGDIHAKFHLLNKLINKKKPELIIAVGDFGYWPKFNFEKLSDIKLDGATLLWCDGNHEDHWSLSKRDKDEIVSNIFYMPRGSTYELPDGRVILFMGGADSIDKHLRMVGRDWFPEEIITQKDMINLPDKKIDIFITHTCPKEVLPKLKLLYPLKDFEPSNEALTQLWKIYKPDLWYFGHWHQYKTGNLENTKWTCLSAAGFGDQWWGWLPEKYLNKKEIMSLQEKIKEDLKQAIKNKNEVLVDSLKIIIGELQRLPLKIVTDNEVLLIIKKLIKYETEMLTAIKAEDASSYLQILQTYLPNQIEESIIREWISTNIDWSTLKNKMQAVGIIKKHFGSSVDGDIVKQIVQTY